MNKIEMLKMQRGVRVEGTDVAGDLAHENPVITPDSVKTTKVIDCQWVVLPAADMRSSV